MKSNNIKTNSKNINLNETHEQQVMRVVREMVATGEMEMTITDGEERFTLPAACNAQQQAKRSLAAKKAWATRKRAAGVNSCKSSIKTSSVKFKPLNCATKVKTSGITTCTTNTKKVDRVAAAHKAVATRRSNALKAKRVAAAHKAVATRRLNAKNALLCSKSAK